MTESGATRRTVKVYDPDNDGMAEISLVEELPRPCQAGKWANFFLVTSNLHALYIVSWAWRHGLYGTVIAFLNVMLASMAFHAYERYKHPSLPGLFSADWYSPTSSPQVEFFLLTWDRISAIICGLVVIFHVGVTNVLASGVLSGALLFNCVSELHFVGIVGSPAWDRYVYPIAHSMWHVCVFSAGYVLLTSHVA